jgi:hypothetical protein
MGIWTSIVDLMYKLILSVFESSVEVDILAPETGRKGRKVK